MSAPTYVPSPHIPAHPLTTHSPSGDIGLIGLAVMVRVSRPLPLRRLECLL